MMASSLPTSPSSYQHGNPNDSADHDADDEGSASFDYAHASLGSPTSINTAEFRNMVMSPTRNHHTNQKNGKSTDNQNENGVDQKKETEPLDDDPKKSLLLPLYHDQKTMEDKKEGNPQQQPQPQQPQDQSSSATTTAEPSILRTRNVPTPRSLRKVAEQLPPLQPSPRALSSTTSGSATTQGSEPRPPSRRYLMYRQGLSSSLTMPTLSSPLSSTIDNSVQKQERNQNIPEDEPSAAAAGAGVQQQSELPRRSPTRAGAFSLAMASASSNPRTSTNNGALPPRHKKVDLHSKLNSQRALPAQDSSSKDDDTHPCDEESKQGGQRKQEDDDTHPCDEESKQGESSKQDGNGDNQRRVQALVSPPEVKREIVSLSSHLVAPADEMDHHDENKNEDEDDSRPLDPPRPAVDDSSTDENKKMTRTWRNDNKYFRLEETEASSRPEKNDSPATVPAGTKAEADAATSPSLWSPETLCFPPVLQDDDDAAVPRSSQPSATNTNEDCARTLSFPPVLQDQQGNHVPHSSESTKNNNGNSSTIVCDPIVGPPTPEMMRHMERNEEVEEEEEEDEDEESDERQQPTSEAMGNKQNKISEPPTIFRENSNTSEGQPTRSLLDSDLESQTSTDSSSESKPSNSTRTYYALGKEPLIRNQPRATATTTPSPPKTKNRLERYLNSNNYSFTGISSTASQQQKPSPESNKDNESVSTSYSSMGYLLQSFVPTRTTFSASSRWRSSPMVLADNGNNNNNNNNNNQNKQNQNTNDMAEKAPLVVGPSSSAREQQSPPSTTAPTTHDNISLSNRSLSPRVDQSSPVNSQGSSVDYSENNVQNLSDQINRPPSTDLNVQDIETGSGKSAPTDATVSDQNSGDGSSDASSAKKAQGADSFVLSPAYGMRSSTGDQNSVIDCETNEGEQTDSTTFTIVAGNRQEDQMNRIRPIQRFEATTEEELSGDGSLFSIDKSHEKMEEADDSTAITARSDPGVNDENPSQNYEESYLKKDEAHAIGVAATVVGILALIVILCALVILLVSLNSDDDSNENSAVAAPSGNSVPRGEPTPSPTSFDPSVQLVLTLSTTNSNGSLPECHGHCRKNSDCASTLECFQRDEFELVPGCIGNGASGISYCYRPIPTDSPTPAPWIFHLDDECTEATYLPGELTTEEDGLLLSAGLAARKLTRARFPVQYDMGLGQSTLPMHLLSDGGGIVQSNDGSGDYFYITNSRSATDGGVSALRFTPSHHLISFERIMSGMVRNRGGGVTPWGTFLSCGGRGQTGGVWEIDPNTGYFRSTNIVDQGGNYDSVAYDDDDKDGKLRFFITEDARKGALVRYTPSDEAASDRNLHLRLSSDGGTHEFLVLRQDNTYFWTTTRDLAEESALAIYKDSKGMAVRDGSLYFVSESQQQLFTVDLRGSTYHVASTVTSELNNRPDQVAVIPGSSSSILYVTEGGGRDCDLHGRDGETGQFFTVLRALNSRTKSTGIAFSPDKRAMYITYQGSSSIYQVRRTDGCLFDDATGDISFS